MLQVTGTDRTSSSGATLSLAVSVIVPVFDERHLVGTSLSRLLRIQDPVISRLQVIVVDDYSSDGSWEIVTAVAQADPRVVTLRHDRNLGKGAAIRTGLTHADGDVTVIHDADLEYNPADIPDLIRPFVLEGADAVFGSRYLAAPYRRALGYRHSLMNRTLTSVSNWVTDLDLTDVETCYKAVRTRLLKSIPIRNNDFRIEVELATKLAKRRARVFEVPIRYLPRSYREGKKIGFRDGLLAIGALAHFLFVDDLYKDDQYGSPLLRQPERTRRFLCWLGDTLRPFAGDRVLEIGAGIGTLTEQFIPRESYLASDINPVYLDYLRAYSLGKPYLDVRHIDVSNAADFDGLDGGFDTAFVVNVLAHVPDEHVALGNIRRVLEVGGRVVVLVPQHSALYGTLDEALEHRRRYSRDGLQTALQRAGFHVEQLFDFNGVSIPSWWLNGRVLKRRTFSRVQLKLLDMAVPILRRVDYLLPFGGLSLIAVARRGD